MERSKEKKHGLSFKAGFLLCLLLVAQLVGAAAVLQTKKQDGTLEITVEELENSKGMVRLAIFKGAEGFPENRQKAVKTLSVPAKKGSVQVSVDELPAGRYAIAVLHDENENGEMDTNFVGYPQEDYGFSNNQLPAFRAPTFDEASFEIKEGTQVLSIRIRN